LEILLGPGNENEQRYLLPLLDRLAEAGGSARISVYLTGSSGGVVTIAA